jgi:hypothetical protein
VYPFPPNLNVDVESIETAAEGLLEAAVQIGAGNSDASQASLIRQHYCTIRMEDISRLITEEELLNDPLVDFWMRWCVTMSLLYRHQSSNCVSSEMFTFLSIG